MKTCPYDGLKNISIEEYKNNSPYTMYKKVEELAPSYQAGQTSDFYLFLYFIKVLVDYHIDFLVGGGIILNAIFHEHSRRSNDIDVLVKDPDVFFEDINRAISNLDSDIRFEAKWLKKRFANENYYYNTFAFEIYAYHQDELLKSFYLEGKFIDYYDEIEKVRYDGVIAENYYFYGVSPEYIASDKLLGVTSALLRSYKHLVDLYTFTNINLDIDKLNRIIQKTLVVENEVLARFNEPMRDNNLLIKEDKSFLDSYFFTALSAGYLIEKDEMLSKINSWIKENIQIKS